MQWLKDTAERLNKAAVSETAPSNVLKRLIKTVQEDFMTRKNVCSLSNECLELICNS